jgi:PEP-CTERM motif
MDSPAAVRHNTCRTAAGAAAPVTVGKEAEPMPVRSLLAAALAAGLLVFAAPAHAEPIRFYFYGNQEGPDFDTNPTTPDGSHFSFEALPTYLVRPLVVEGSFQGKVYQWLAMMRFQSQAAFNANRDTATGLVAETPFFFNLGLSNSPGIIESPIESDHFKLMHFSAHASGQMTYADPTLNIAFDDPVEQATLGDTLIEVALAVTQHRSVTPGVQYPGSPNFVPPLPAVTDIQATITVRGASGSGGGSDPPPPVTPPGSGGDPTPKTPEPGTLVLAGLGVATLVARRLVRTRSDRTSKTAAGLR